MNKFANLKEKWEDEKLVKEFRKIAKIAGFDVSYFGEVISDRDRKYRASLKKYHSRNMKYVSLIIKECEKFNISAITVLSPYLWIGDYGKILSGAEKLKYTNHPDDYCIINSKYIWKTIRGLYNPHNSKKWEKYTFSDGTEHYFYMPNGHKKIRYGSGEWDELIVLSNGQVFDVGNVYWFTIKDSHRLTREIKRGYEYIEPQYFFDDFFGCDDEDDIEEE
jgi:hypothetical protein